MQGILKWTSNAAGCASVVRRFILLPKEFDLLAYLFSHQGGTILHSKLLRAVWGLEYGGEREYLRTYVGTLRKKIEDDPARPQYILTEPWVGYMFCDSCYVRPRAAWADNRLTTIDKRGQDRTRRRMTGPDEGWRRPIPA